MTLAASIDGIVMEIFPEPSKLALPVPPLLPPLTLIERAVFNFVAVSALPVTLPVRFPVNPPLPVTLPAKVVGDVTDCALAVVLSNLLFALSLTAFTAFGVAATTPVAALSVASIAS